MATETISTSIIADDAVTGAKIENNPTVAGNLTVSGTSTLTGNSTVGGTLATTGALTASGGIANAGTITAGTLGSSVSVQAGSPIAVQLASSQSSSATTQVDFNNTLITDSYKTYRIIFNLVIPATDSTEPIVQVSLDNGSSFLTGIDSRRMFHQMVTSSSSGQEHTQASYIQIGTDIGNDANQGFGGHIDLFGLRSTDTHYAFGYANCVGKHGTSSYWWDNGIHIPKGGSTAINFLRFVMSSGDIAVHDISFWGFK